MPVRSAFLVGDGIAEFVPLGYDPAKTPSLDLQAEPPRRGGLPGVFPIRPVFTHETLGAWKDPDILFQRGTKEFSVAEVDAPAGTTFYGTGEVNGSLVRNNTSIDLWNTDNYHWRAYDGRRLYESHPWVLGVRPDGTAFGVLFDTTWKSRLSCGDHDIQFQSEGPAFRTFVIDRASPEAVLEGLAELTGCMQMPPRWALGFHQSRFSYYPDARVRQIADGFRSRHIPCDVIWLDIDYMNGFRVFTFDPNRFPDPPGLNAYLHGRGFRSVCIIDPGVKIENGYAPYDSGQKIGAWVKAADGNVFQGRVWPGVCAFPDFTVPAVRDWWAGLYGGLLAKGIDGIWNDMNEPAIFINPDFTMPEDCRHAGGGDLPPGPHTEYHNVYGMLMARATQEGLEKARPDKRPFVLTRASFLGGQRYSAMWTGDDPTGMETLQETIPMQLNVGLSGQPFSGSDIGGFIGVTDPDVFGHWIAIGAFYPFCRAHKENNRPDSEPWAFGPKVEAASRTALDRRYRLMPYLYTVFHEASEIGLPVMRPIFMADPADMALRTEQQAFTLGRDLMVTPAWAKDVKMPRAQHGPWRSVALLDQKLESDGFQPGLKIRPGSIIPLGRVIETTADDSSPMTLLVSLDDKGRAEGDLYWDSGDGPVSGAVQHYAAQKSGGELVVRWTNPAPGAAAGPVPTGIEVVTGDFQTIGATGDLRAGIHCRL